MRVPVVVVAGLPGDARRAAPNASSRVWPPGALREEVQNAFAYLPATLIGMLAGIAIVVWLFSDVAPPAWWAPWLGAFGVLWLLRLLLLTGYRRAVRSAAIEWLAWYRVWVVATLASGVLWGLTGWLFYGLGSGLQQTGLVIVIYSYCIAAVPVLANQRAVFHAFVGLSFLPLVARIASIGDPDGLRLACELVFIVGLTTLLVRSYGQALQRVTELKLRADDLLEQLRAEKRVAEAARHEAEVASRAKTQFLAAASHDLRQPLHAMGLFAEALRQRSHAPDVARLVDSINESVDALEGLFSGVLDITRLDSGAVESQPLDFAVGDVFRRLRLHFEPAAFEKGLVLRVRGDRHVLHGDPLLVERIVRNAIRYTDDGTVLVTCRRRGGRARVQVWDTGIGIPEADQTRIFEEFYQVPGRRAVTTDQRKGLGLGLAIVARLAALLDAPLTVRSAPGRGSVFTLELPCGTEPPQDVTPPLPGPASALTLGGHLVLVVEDDAAVRDGLEVLLASWGAEVVSLPGLDATRDWLDGRGRPTGPTPAPALVITDYRLDDGTTGLDVIAAVRARHGPAVPALVVSGTSTTELEGRAQELGFHLLVKPVLPSRLRAMVGFKLQRRDVPS